MPTSSDRVLKNSQRRETEARKSQKKKGAERGSPLFFPLKMQLKKKAGGTLLYIIIFRIIN